MIFDKENGHRGSGTPKAQETMQRLLGPGVVSNSLGACVRQLPRGHFYYRPNAAGLQKAAQQRELISMQWTKSPAGDLRLMDGPRVVAEVQRLADGRFLWQRFTSIDDDGVPPAKGREGTKREAMQKAASGLTVQA